MKRYLVTTADERTWPVAEPIYFLGEWCRRHNRQCAWKNLDAEVVNYHWDDREKLRRDYKYLKGLYEQILVQISRLLNEKHGVDYSMRYWRILVGPWLGYFIQILFDRWAMLKHAITEYEIDKCCIVNRDVRKSVPHDMEQFCSFFIEDDWNEAIYGQLLGKYLANEVDVEVLECSSNELNLVCEAAVPSRVRLKKLISNGLGIINRCFPQDHAYFFISSYLPVLDELKLQLKLGQLPKIWRPIPVPPAEIDLDQRKWNWQTDREKGEFEKILYDLIPQHIPVAYLEGYVALSQCVKSLPWPECPKSVFTCNAHSSDDVFKAWVAEKKEIGIPLLIGQHGGHYGMAPWAFHEEHQISIADYWLSWGWEDQNNSKIVPVGKIKACTTKVKHNPKGGALMVQMAMPRYSYHMYSAPVAGQWLPYFEEQVRFVSTLPEKLRRQVNVRLYVNDYGWNQKERWHEHFPKLCISNALDEKITNAIRKSRIYVSTYNATTYLESLAWNIPTIVFWNSLHWELREDVIPYFNLLKSVGIFHETPELAAQQMINVWDETSVWWYSQEVQEARNAFCERFSCVSNNTIGKLQLLLRKTEFGTGTE